MPENALYCGTSPSAGRILIVSGERKAGKTAFCLELASQAASQELSLAGIISRSRFLMGSENGKIAWDLAGGGTRLLASTVPGELTGGGIGPWTFDADALAWVNGCFASIADCDLLLVDELGPLELEQGQGWQAALSALQRVPFKLAAVVIRPVLVAKGQQLFPGAKVLEINSDSDIPALAAEVLSGVMMDTSGKATPAGKK